MSDREPTADELLKTLSESIAGLRDGEVNAADDTPMIVESHAHALAQRCQPRFR